MKREFVSEENFSSSGRNCTSDKGKMWSTTEEEDELFAALGYTVKPSDMAEVAQKIHQIEMAMWNAPEDGFSQLAADTVHYNPSDISSWLESMRSGLFPITEFESCSDPFFETTAVATAEIGRADRMDLGFGSDLVAIPGKAVYPRAQPKSPEKTHPAKKVKTCGGDVAAEETRSLLVDSQENGIRLVHALMMCAEAVQQENLKLAEVLVNNIGVLASSQAGAMRKVATCFAKALARRIYKIPTSPPDSDESAALQMHFYEACPYLKFAHFTANQAILQVFAGKKRVHVIDFSIKQGVQWPPLLQALASMPGGPPTFKLTGIGPPSKDHADPLQEVGFRLSQLAKEINLDLDFRGIVANSLSDLDLSMFDIDDGETVAVNSIFDLHQMLAPPGGGIDRVLRLIRDLKPEILTVVEQEANHNGNFFLDRFTESLHYYSTLFDSLESAAVGAAAAVSEEDAEMSEFYLEQQICNVVACEGPDRVERHETLVQWRNRFCSTGFEPVHLGSNVYKEATMILAVSGGHGYSVDESNGCLMLGWHNRPLIATSAWMMCRNH